MNPLIRLYMSMSLDGFIAGPDDRTGQELGRGGGRLFNWMDDRMSDGPSGRVFREAIATGAVISGRRTFELAGRWQGDHHDGVPIFVLTHRIDDGDVPPGSARFVTDVEDCAEQLAELLQDGRTTRGMEAFSRRSVAHGGREWSSQDVRPGAGLRLYQAVAESHWILAQDGRPDHRIPVKLT